MGYASLNNREEGFDEAVLRSRLASTTRYYLSLLLILIISIVLRIGRFQVRLGLGHREILIDSIVL